MPIRTFLERIRNDEHMTEADPDDGDEHEETDGETGEPTGAVRDVQDLEHRIDEMETEFDSTNTQLRSIQDSQERVSDEVEEMQQTVRRLLGIYEQVTDDVNPFTEGTGEGGAFEFGLLSRDDPTAATDGGEQADDGSVGIGDLREARAAEPFEEPDDAREDLAVEHDHEDGRDGAGAGDRHAAGSETGESVRTPVHDWSMSTQRRDDPTPIRHAATYATDIIVFQWLSELIASSSPAAAINAVSYYHEIGWISDGTESYLLDVLSGPHLDATVDPADPASLEAGDHAESYAYIRKLAAVREMNGADS